MAGPSTRPTIKDVAAMAGVDRAVVSKVLSDDPALRIRDETRERVKRAAKTLNYRPNIFAQGLATQRSTAFGLLIPTYGNPVYSEIVTGAEEVAKSRSLLLWTASVEGYGSDSFAPIVQGGLLKGVLVAGSRADVHNDLVTATGLPILEVNRRSPGANRWIILNDELAAAKATNHLIELGHRTIGFVGGPSWADTATRRFNGFLSAMEEAGLTPEPQHIVGADYTPKGGAKAGRRLIELVNRPTGVVVANALTALGVWKEIAGAGIHVPHQFSIVAIHHLPSEQHRTEPLTSVKLPLKELGRRAAEILLDSDASTTIEVVIEQLPRLVPGATAGPPPR